MEHSTERFIVISNIIFPIRNGTKFTLYPL